LPNDLDEPQRDPAPQIKPRLPCRLPKLSPSWACLPVLDIGCSVSGVSTRMQPSGVRRDDPDLSPLLRRRLPAGPAGQAPGEVSLLGEDASAAALPAGAP